MICHLCKDKVASIRLKEIIGGEITELQLCQDCYEKREQEGTGVAESSAADIVSSLTGAGKEIAESEPESCSACGTTKPGLQEKGRLGCSNCYMVFSASLEPILLRVHSSVEHRGKIPQPADNLDMKKELRRLQEDLQDAIMSENYERAAKLRDKIRVFEDK
jgi:protein arginine kinase activator